METKWKNSNKELPDTDRDVLITDGYEYGSGRYIREEYGISKWKSFYNCDAKPRFWMDIPELPAE